MGQIDLDDLSTPEHGYTVNDEYDDDPVLLDREGNHVDTWRERYPYDHRMPRAEYERLKRRIPAPTPWAFIAMSQTRARPRSRNGRS